MSEPAFDAGLDGWGDTAAPARSRRAAILAVLAAERGRWSLWLPVLLGCGIALYFALPTEPPAWLGGAAALAAALGTWVVRRRAGLLIPGIALCALSIGFAVVQMRAAVLAAPVLARETSVSLSGRVLAVEDAGRSQRVVLDRLTFERPLEPAPERVRVRLTPKSSPVRPGERISLRAVLTPPSPPLLPNGFDFARQAWFDGLGAVGYAVSRSEQVSPGPQGGLMDGLRLTLAELRHSVTARIRTAIGGDAGAVSAALVTGEQSGISEPMLDAYRDSGLAHLLSISGLHMSMVAGLVFLVVRGGLALWPAVALRRPIKKWAAAAALLVTAVYLLVAGAPVPTLRSFLMLGLVLAAVLLDRTAISMRLVAWAAAAVLLLVPEALVGPSFQMSFAAVVALVAAYESVAPRLRAWQGEDPGWMRRGALYVAGVGLTTLIAGSATAPYGIFHFQRYAVFSLAANLAAVPLTGFWVMPWAIVAVLAMPLGLEAWPLAAMGMGVEWVNQTARAVAAWPAASLDTPALPIWGLMAFTIGGLWLSLWRARWRRAGVPLLALGLASMTTSRPPDLLVTGSGELVAVRAADGRLLLSSRSERIARETWQDRVGGGRPTGPFPTWSDDGRLACDPQGCILRADGRSLAVVFDGLALAEDCAAADGVLALLPARRICRAPVVVDRFDLWRFGTHAVWLTADGVRVESAAGWQGDRRWSRKVGE